MRAALAIVCAGLTVASATATPPEGLAEILVRVEREFAERALAEGTKRAFVDVLDPEGVLFRPAPVRGLAWYADREGPGGILSWTPDWVALSASGDLGCTSGPWTFRDDSRDGASEATGTYVSVWRRQPDSSRWRLLADGGVTHPPRSRPGAPRTIALRPAAPSATRDAVAIEGETRWTGPDCGARCAGLSSPSLRVLRDGHPPADGAEKGCALAVAARRAETVYHVSGSGISAAGDLAFAYGTVGPEGAPPGSTGGFLHVFSFEGGEWRRLVDLELPPSPPAPDD